MVEIDRHYGLDWLRIAAFALLILYHIGMVFVPWEFHIKAAETVDALQFPMLALNPWRLILLFVVSGYATRALAKRSSGSGELIKSRTLRLIVPLLFGIAVILPLQPWVELRVGHDYPRGFWHFLTNDYFRFGTLDGLVLPTWNHLWFIVYLWVYTGLLAILLIALPKSVRDKLQRGWNRLFGPFVLLILPIIWLLVVRMWLHPIFEETHALFDDWAAHAVYYPAFLLGWAMAGSGSIWATLAKLHRPSMALALVAGVAFVGIEVVFEGEQWSPMLILTARLARSAFAWATIIGLLALADYWRGADGPWRRTLTEAIFPFYLIHQTIIIGVEYAIQPLRMTAALEFAVVACATIVGCWIFYDVGRRIGWLRPMIGLKRDRAMPNMPTPPVAISSRAARSQTRTQGSHPD